MFKSKFPLVYLMVLGFCFISISAFGKEKAKGPNFPIEKLKSGGYVVFFRHAARENIPSQSALWELDGRSACDVGSALNTKGEEESREIADALKRLELSSNEVYVSPTCRTKQMAKILFGDNFTVEKFLAPPWVKNPDKKAEDAAALKSLLGKSLPQGGGINRFIISHSQVLTDESIGKEILLEQTEAAVFRPMPEKNGQPSFKFLGIIYFKDWLKNASTPVGKVQ